MSDLDLIKHSRSEKLVIHRKSLSVSLKQGNGKLLRVIIVVNIANRPSKMENKTLWQTMVMRFGGGSEVKKAIKSAANEKYFKKLQRILDYDHDQTLSSPQRDVLHKYIMKNELPENLRVELWLRGSGAKTLMNDPSNHGIVFLTTYVYYLGYYKSILEDIPGYPNPCIYQIELDLHRTFNSDELTLTKSMEWSLRRILTAYVKRNPTVGYCQGMNFVTAILLKHLTEEQAFWTLCQIVEAILQPDYYTMMTGVIVDQKCFDELLEHYLPDLKAHLDDINFGSENYITQWFVCCYANTFNFPTVYKLWDLLF